jgi:hypothetical protein
MSDPWETVQIIDVGEGRTVKIMLAVNDWNNGQFDVMGEDDTAQIELKVPDLDHDAAVDLVDAIHHLLLTYVKHVAGAPLPVGTTGFPAVQEWLRRVAPKLHDELLLEGHFGWPTQAAKLTYVGHVCKVWLDGAWFQAQMLRCLDDGPSLGAPTRPAP